MPAATQANANLAIRTPLGEDAVLVHRASITEQLSRLFRIDVVLSSEDPDIPFEKIVGANATLRLSLLNRQQRFFNGFVSRFEQIDADRKSGQYLATLVPWLWFLTRTSDCLIFQNMTVPDIIKKIFRDHGFADFRDALSGHYVPWENCVQYRETDFNFVSRLMEQEGIYYFFTHEDGKHILVLADGIAAHEPFPDYETIPFHGPSGGVLDSEKIGTWNVAQEVQPGTYAVNDFNFETPKTPLLAQSKIVTQHSQNSYEIFDHPGEYEKHGEGIDYSKVRIEELHSQQEVVGGTGNARGLAVGSVFTLTDAPRRDQNRKYLITSANYELTSDAMHTGGGGAGAEEDPFSCNFTALDAAKPFRAARITPKPLIQGPQTAIVVGPKGEEIYTDPYGRVRVQFHWDRHGQSDEFSSCWVRVSHPGTAGKGWGALNIPRIGHEVIVEFLEGDPDLPIITGHVYNAYTMPKYELPANKTQSGLISRSTPGGTANNYNELRFEDKIGKEQFFVQAEKDMIALIKHDETRTVGHDQTLEVGHDRHTTVKHDETHEVRHDRATTIKNDEVRVVTNNQTLTIEKGTQQVTIQEGAQIINVKGAIDIKSDAQIVIHVGKSQIIINEKGITLIGDRIDLNPS